VSIEFEEEMPNKSIFGVYELSSEGVCAKTKEMLQLSKVRPYSKDVEGTMTMECVFQGYLQNVAIVEEPTMWLLVDVR